MLPIFFLRTRFASSEFSQTRYFSKKIFSPKNLHGKLGILGVPFGKGQNKKGKTEIGLKIAPDVIRSAGFVDDLIDLGVDIEDYGNVDYKPICGLRMHNMHNFDHFAPCAKSVSDSVECVLEEGRSCLVLGGDHSVAVGSVHGHLKVADSREVAMLFVDAHPDINTNVTSPSGNVHGMTIALVCQELQSLWEESDLKCMDWQMDFLTLKNIAYIGTRSVDHGEATFLRENNVAVFGTEDVEKLGIHKVIRNALERIDPGRNKSLHVSFDIDALDPLEAPCTTTPERGGLTLREAIYIAESLHKTQRVSVVDMVEVNVGIGNESQKQITLEAVNHILLAMYGHSRKGN